MNKKRDEREPAPAPPEHDPEEREELVVEVDAAESRWDPWLAALARLEAEARPN